MSLQGTKVALVCRVCGEGNPPNVTYCRVCGANIPWRGSIDRPLLLRVLVGQYAGVVDVRNSGSDLSRWARELLLTLQGLIPRGWCQVFQKQWEDSP